MVPTIEARKRKNFSVHIVLLIWLTVLTTTRSSVSSCWAWIRLPWGLTMVKEEALPDCLALLAAWSDENDVEDVRTSIRPDLRLTRVLFGHIWHMNGGSNFLDKIIP